jgi:hypothetical protein
LQPGDAVCSAPRTGGFAGFARPAHSPLIRAICAPLLRSRGLPAGWSRQALIHVLVRSNNHGRVPATAFPPPVETPDGFSPDERAVSWIAAHRQVPGSHFRPGATPDRGTGDFMPPPPSLQTRLRSRAHQLHPTFYRLPGFISGWAVEMTLSHRTLVLSKNWGEARTTRAKRQPKILHK